MNELTLERLKAIKKTQTVSWLEINQMIDMLISNENKINMENFDKAYDQHLKGVLCGDNNKYAVLGFLTAMME